MHTADACDLPSGVGLDMIDTMCLMAYASTTQTYLLKPNHYTRISKTPPGMDGVFY